jgi:hypothetical protein
MPRTLNYQGTLSDGSKPVPDGNYKITFRLYITPSGGTKVWDEPQEVTTRSGVFNAILGKTTPLPESFNTSYWLTLQVGDDPELSPRLEMTGVCYSLHSLVSDSAAKVSAGSVATAQLADGAVTAAKIADATITGTKVALATLMSVNIIDMPGISSSVFMSGDLNAGNILYVLDSLDINLPSSGTVMLIATGYVTLAHKHGEPTAVLVGISDNSTDIPPYGSNYCYLDSGLPDHAQTLPFSASTIHSVGAAGPRRYYLLAHHSYGQLAGTGVYGTRLTAMYFPAQLGPLSVSTAGPQDVNNTGAGNGSSPRTPR